MEFRLFYKGPLPAEKYKDKGVPGSGAVGKAAAKHKLRKHFHLQLRELWQQDPGLRAQAETYFLKDASQKYADYTEPGEVRFLTVKPGTAGAKKYIDLVADANVVCNGNRFVPLVSEKGGFTCSLDILFLRRDDPGSLVDSKGDIDNRIKVLFDGLRMPAKVEELGGLPIDADEDPFFTLLENDRHITKVSVTTDRLIIPLDEKRGEKIEDVLLVIHVTIVNPVSLFAGGRLV
jgi:hypothetical protein